MNIYATRVTHTLRSRGAALWLAAAITLCLVQVVWPQAAPAELFDDPPDLPMPLDDFDPPPPAQDDPLDDVAPFPGDFAEAELEETENELGIRKPSPDEQAHAFEILNAVKFVNGVATATPFSAAGNPAASASALAVLARGYSLSSSTPVLPFVGNQMVLVGGVPNAAALADVTARYRVTLRRRRDCSWSEALIDTAARSPQTAVVASMPGAQTYLHALSGLTTTGNIYATGCVHPVLGSGTVSDPVIVGRYLNKQSVIAAIDGSGALVLRRVDAVANTVTKTTLLSSASISGSFALADLNRDGYRDIIATFVKDPGNLQLSTAIFLSNGDGTFKAGVYYPVVGDVTVHDFNGDGKPDIAVLTNPGVTTLLGIGDGTFRIGPVSAPGRTIFGSAAHQVLSRDFNGDGKIDLLANGTVLLGAGDGSFTLGAPISGITDDAALYGGDRAVGDFNQDGHLDVVAQAPGFIAVFLGNGDGTFRAGPRYASLGAYEQVAVIDVDGDGHLDVVVGTISRIAIAGAINDPLPLSQVVLGRGDGTFVGAPIVPQGPYFPLTGSHSVEVGDFDADGNIDVLVSNPNLSGSLASSTLDLYGGNGAGQLGSVDSSAIAIKPGRLVSADMNQDGKPDVVVTSTPDNGTQLAVLLNLGGGHFGAEHDYALPNYPVSLAVADFNGDGRMDVAVGVQPLLGQSGVSGVYVLLGQANGTLGAPTRVDSSLSPQGLAAGDIDGDGRSDLLIADQGFFSPGTPRQVNGALHLYRANADGTFSALSLPATSATNYTTVALGDFNHDGTLDVMAAGIVGIQVGVGTPNVYTFLGNGHGNFGSAVAEPLAGTDGVGATSLVLADFNKDGTLDVALGNPQDFTEVLIGRGDGGFAHALLAVGERPSSLAAADLKHDGFPALLIGNAGGVAVMANAGTWSSGGNLVATSTVLTTSATSINAGETLTLSATVTPGSGTIVPTGTVSFADGATTLGSGTLDAAGKETFATSPLASGTHSLSATYSGSAAFASSSSTAHVVSVATGSPDFGVSLSPTSATATRGQSVTTTVTLTPRNGFNQSVTLSCSGLPAGATCDFAPAAVSVSSGAAQSTLTISTSAVTAMNLNTMPRNPMLPVSACMVCLAAPMARRRRRGEVRRVGHSWLAWALLASVLLGGCSGGAGGSGGTAGGTPTGAYTVTVNATAGSTVHSATYTLTIT